VKVQQDYDGSWSVWDDSGVAMLAGGLPSHAAAWAEVDRRTRRPNWKPASCGDRMGAFDKPGKMTRWTPPWRSKRGNNRKKCEECGINWADPPRRICVGCQAYRDHTGHF
jgi:hypothetical protein